MKISKLAFATMLAGSLLPLTASAQTCQGLPDFSAGRFQVGGTGSFIEGAQEFAGTLSMGSKAVFGGVSAGAQKFDGLDGNTPVIGAGIGYQVPLSSSGTVQLCPVMNASIGLGPKNIDVLGTDVDLTSRDFLLGISLGTALGTSSSFHFVPSAGAGLAYTSIKAKAFGESQTESETYGILSIGAGLVFNSVLAVRPDVNIPVGLDNADTTFGVSVAMNFGRQGMSR